MPADGTAIEKKKNEKQEGSVKETIESILIAFILILVLRAFVVEPFVIPTGSMAPTLMGAHMRVTCDDCGYSFAVNYLTRNDTDIPAYANPRLVPSTVVCPNCGYHQPLGRNAPEPVYYGDRILVLKYRYLFQEPRRWEVVILKSPYEGARDPEDPKYSDNYIKRLVGKPDESVMILGGDVYIGHPGQKPEQFQVQRKPDFVQDAMWRLVFDNDYLPHGLDRIGSWQEPWEVLEGSGWRGPAHGIGAASRVFTFDNGNDGSTIGFNSLANHPDFDMFTDWLAYDEGTPDNGSSFVSDLKISCVYRRTAGNGPLRLQMTKRGECFTAEFIPGKVRLHRNKLAADHPIKLGSSLWPAPLEADCPDLADGGKPIEIVFTNVDYRVTVRVNGRPVIETTEEQYHSNVAQLYQEALENPRMRGRTQDGKPAVEISADHQSCALSHIFLGRDVYYLNSGHGGRYTENGVPSGEPFWGSPENVQTLGPDEYFVLGDNSSVSLDARYWGAPVDLPHEGNYHVAAGKVPGRFMLGKAFIVYWPAGYRPAFSRFGVEPDFGDMRFIH